MTVLSLLNIMRINFKFWVLLFLLLLVNFGVYSRLKLPSIIGSNMVLQQQSSVKFWGTASPLKKISIVTSWDNHKCITKSDKDGNWLISLITPKAGGPYDIKITEEEQLVLQNILIGEVWVCSGQSNMEMHVKGFNNQPVNGSLDIIARARKETPIRLFTVKRNMSKTPLGDCSGKWSENTPENVADASGVAYFFGKYLQEALNVPVGLIMPTWGGTKVEDWMNRKSIESFKEIDLSNLDNNNTPVDDPNKVPCVLYNAMIHPLINFAIKGAIWYQGESNANQPALYRRLMPAFVKGLRDDWGSGEFPFYYVQIAPYKYQHPDSVRGAKLREVQMQNLQDIPNSGMAITLDIGSKDFIHPPEKIKVGNRLAYWALSNTYGRTGYAYCGPVYKSMEVLGSKALISFDHTEGGLTPMGKLIENFEIAGSDKVFYPAKAMVEMKKGTGDVLRDRLEVESDKVQNPVAVRYAFRNYVEASLFNGFGLPASSFRTDEWESK